MTLYSKNYRNVDEVLGLTVWKTIKITESMFSVTDCQPWHLYMEENSLFTMKFFMFIIIWLWIFSTYDKMV